MEAPEAAGAAAPPRQRPQQPQPRPRQQPSSAAWDAFVAGQVLQEPQQPPPNQTAAPQPGMMRHCIFVMMGTAGQQQLSAVVRNSTGSMRDLKSLGLTAESLESFLLS